MNGFGSLTACVHNCRANTAKILWLVLVSRALYCTALRDVCFVQCAIKYKREKEKKTNPNEKRRAENRIGFHELTVGRADITKAF